MLTGSCLCGGVRYEIDGRIGPMGHCHCSTCRKAQGGAFVTNAPVRSKYFRLLSGADLVAEFESSPGKKRCFCRTCGSPLWSRRQSEPEIIRIRLGLLDSDPGRRPLAHVWVSEKAPWYEITDDLPRSQHGIEELRDAGTRPCGGEARVMGWLARLPPPSTATAVSGSTASRAPRSTPASPSLVRCAARAGRAFKAKQ